MKHLAALALILNLGAASVYAQEKPVSMRFSGTSEASVINLQPDTSTGESNFAGNGTLGPFTFRGLTAQTASPVVSSTCSGPTLLYFQFVAGGGVFRFQDGSLLTVGKEQGAVCVDLTVPEGHATLTYQITGGTGPFKGASGTLTMTATAPVVLVSVTSGPVILAVTGQITGTISF